MSEPYKPRNGDRLRVTQDFEGVVKVLPRGYFEVVTDSGESHGFFDEELDNAGPFAFRFELIAPALPTTPGSVIRYNDTRWIRQLRHDGLWQRPDGVTVHPDGVERATRADGFTVVFDAGAEG